MNNSKLNSYIEAELLIDEAEIIGYAERLGLKENSETSIEDWWLKLYFLISGAFIQYSEN